MLDCAGLLAPPLDSLSHQEVSSFKAMTEAMGAGDATVGTAAFRKSGDTPHHSRGVNVFLLALPAPGATEQRPPVAQKELAVLPTTQQETATAQAASALETNISQKDVIEQLKARLPVAEAACAVMEAIPSKGHVAPARVAARAAVAPIEKRGSPIASPIVRGYLFFVQGGHR